MEMGGVKYTAETALQGVGQGADYLGQALSEITRTKGQTPESMKIAGEEFEAYFIANLMRIMRETVHEGFLENKAGKNFYYFYDMEIGRLSAKAGGMGLAKMIEEYAQQQNLVQDQKKDSSSSSALPIKITDR
jgi:flagellar protein FlgJ